MSLPIPDSPIAKSGLVDSINMHLLVDSSTTLMEGSSRTKSIHHNPKVSPLYPVPRLAFSNDLFHVTNEMRLSKNEDQTQTPLSLFPGKRLDNSKIDRMMRDLENGRDNSSQIEDMDYDQDQDKIDRMMQELEQSQHDDFALDSLLRSRFSRNRFGPPRNPINSDPIDSSISKFLDPHDKENASPFCDPPKTATKNPFLAKRHKPNPLAPSSSSELNSLGRTLLGKPSQIPVLRPMHTATVPLIVSPQRICRPQHRQYPPTTLRPALKANGGRHHNIYVVESLTGLVGDATRFGTELNASQTDDFPLPVHPREIVQIPLYLEEEERESDQPLPVAIIRLLHDRRQQQHLPTATGHRGFYTPHQFEIFRQDIDRTTNETPLTKPSSSPTEHSTRKVHWAEDVEW